MHSPSSLISVVFQDREDYWLPILWAVLVHVIVIFALLVQWPTQHTPPELLPKHIKAALVEMKIAQAKPRKLPVVEPVPTVVPSKPKVVPVVDAKPKNKQLPKADIDLKALQDVVEDEPKVDEPELPLLNENIMAEQSRVDSGELSAAEKERAVVARFALAIQLRVEKFWSRPPSTTSDMQVQLGINLVPTGEVVNVTILKGSGFSVFDRSAMQAVRKAGRFQVPEDSRMFEKHFRQFRMIFTPEGLRP